MAAPLSHRRTFSGKRVLITGGLGFIGSNLALALVGLGARVTIVDSLVPEYGGNLRNLAEIAGRVRVFRDDVREHAKLAERVRGQVFFSILRGRPATWIR